MQKQEMLDAINMKIARKIDNPAQLPPEVRNGLQYFPVMIWNCDKLIEKWPDYFNEWNIILDLWIKKEEPLDKQNDKCIQYVYNLI